MDNQLNIQKLLLDINDFNQSVDLLDSKHGVRVVWDKNNRVIFTRKHHQKNNLNNKYAHEARGLVLEKDTWKVLALPPRTMRRNIKNTDIAKINANLMDGIYKIYKAIDGTCFNMYYYNDRWVISTNNGYDMNCKKWNGYSKTYRQLIEDCLNVYNIDYEDFLDSLNVDYSYSFGFTHPICHKFIPASCNEKKLWFICSTNLNPLHNEYMWSSTDPPLPEIEKQPVYDHNVKINHLFIEAKQAYDNMITHKNDPNYEPCYGFILRSMNLTLTELNSDIYIESSLMRNIRKVWYNNKIRNSCYKENWDFDTAIVMRACLNSSLKKVFKQLGDSQMNILNNNKKVIIDILQCMLKISKTESTYKPLEIVSTKNNNEERDDKHLERKAKVIDETQNIEIKTEYKKLSKEELVYNAAKILFNEFKKDIKYDLFNKDENTQKRVLCEFIINPNNLPIFMSIFPKIQIDNEKPIEEIN